MKENKVFLFSSVVFADDSQVSQEDYVALVFFCRMRTLTCLTRSVVLISATSTLTTERCRPFSRPQLPFAVQKGT